MNFANITTTTDALALFVADIPAYALPAEIETADLSTEGASMADAMSTIGTLDLNTVEWDRHD